MVYIDRLKTYSSLPPKMARISTQWCHLWADSDEELHKFALKLGCKRNWFQSHQLLNHYDLTPSRHAAAIKLGAVEIEIRDWLSSKREVT